MTGHGPCKYTRRPLSLSKFKYLVMVNMANDWCQTQLQLEMS